MTVNELASGYLSFTGRPAATLSVSEYLEFFKIAGVVSNTGNSPLFVGTSFVGNSKEFDSAVSQKHSSKSQEEVQEKVIEPQALISDLPDVSPSAVARTNPTKERDPKSFPGKNKNTSEDKKTKALALLQSVSG